jgi:type II secretory pathway component PulK
MTSAQVVYMSTPPPAFADKDQRGFILIFAIGICLVLAVIAATMARSVQSALRATSTAVEVARARALADGGVEIATALLSASLDTVSVVCGVPGAGVIAIAVEDEAGKVSLNTGNEALLLALFIGLGASRMDSARYVASIADYRDSDSQTRDGGSEDEAYSASGFVPLPKNSDFESVSELDRVWGIPADVRARAKPHLTASTTASGVDAQMVSPALRAILNGGDGEAHFGAVDQRLPAALSAPSLRMAFKVRATGATDGARFVREAILRRPMRPGESTRRLSWMQGELTAKDEAQLAGAEVRPDC